MPFDAREIPGSADAATPTPVPPPQRPVRRVCVPILAGLSAIGLACGWAVWKTSQPEYRFQRGLKALAAGDRAGVLNEARRLRAHKGYQSQAHYLAGALLVKGGRYNEALQELQQVPESSEVIVGTLTLAAECHYREGRFLEAARIAQLAIGHDEQALDARRWLASAFYELGAAPQAAEQLEWIAEAAPLDGRPDRLMGLIEKDHEQYDQAVRHYQESLRRDPKPADRQVILKELAESQVKLNHLEDALATLANCDETAQNLSLAAECYGGLGRLDEAHRAVEKALIENPDCLPALLVKGMLLLSAGETRGAANVFERAVELNPYDFKAHYDLSQAYARLGERQKADEQLALMKQSQALAREFSDLHERVTKDLDDADLRYRLGVLARKLQKPELAQVWFRAALAVNPDHALARAALEEPAGDGRK